MVRTAIDRLAVKTLDQRFRRELETGFEMGANALSYHHRGMACLHQIFTQCVYIFPHICTVLAIECSQSRAKLGLT